MKKLFLVLLAAGLFVACGNKQIDETTAVDSTTVEDTVVAPEQAPVADATQPVAEPTTTDQKATTTNQKTTTTVEKTATTATTTAAVKEEPKTAPQPATPAKTTPTKKRR